MKYFSMFSGVGGFELGMPQDWECVGVSEIDKYASMVLKYHYPNVKNYGDCTDIRWEEVADFDLLTGGSPCQDFSIAGNRRGLSGSRSTLAWEFIRGLRSKQPSNFIWENVKGVMSSRGGWDFANLLIAFSESGYSLWWQVLNAKDFGVPQNRERIFIIGFRDGSPKEVFFKPTSDGLLNEPQEEIKFGNFGGKITTADGIANTLTKSYGELSGDGTKIIIGNRYRLFTPLECERLMSWPDNHTKLGIDDKGNEIEISDSQRYKMCGNGVVSNVVKEVVKNLL